MYGVSRGGMMTFLEMKRNFPMNAAAVVGAVYDVSAFRERAPDVVDEAAKLIPHYSERGVSALQDRSVMDWPESINVPLLMIHGADDDEVPPTEALAFAIKLSNLKKPYELLIYAGDVHEAARNRLDRDARIAAWFSRYLRWAHPAASPVFNCRNAITTRDFPRSPVIGLPLVSFNLAETESWR